MNDRLATQLQETGQISVTGETLGEVFEIVDTLGIDPRQCVFGMRLGNFFTANALLTVIPPASQTNTEEGK